VAFVQVGYMLNVARLKRRIILCVTFAERSKIRSRNSDNFLMAYDIFFIFLQHMFTFSVYVHKILSCILRHFELRMNKTMFYKNPQGTSLSLIMCGVTPRGGKCHTTTLFRILVDCQICCRLTGIYTTLNSRIITKVSECI
jgi:hypothetical protein